MTVKIFEERLTADKGIFYPVVPYDKEDKLLLMDFTDKNTDLTEDILANTNLFTQYINSKLKASGAKYGIGGYNEHRTIYSRSEIFGPHPNVSSGYESSKEEPRRLHLGIDIWGRPYTQVRTPLDAIVHSFAFNNRYGDYGATVILTHQLSGLTFYTLYGHLSLNSIKNLEEGQHIEKGDVFAEFGIPFENGQWPPHLHFQIILNMEGHEGDYPGVCKFSEREKYLNNCPDPDLILNMMKHVT